MLLESSSCVRPEGEDKTWFVELCDQVITSDRGGVTLPSMWDVLYPAQHTCVCLPVGDSLYVRSWHSGFNEKHAKFPVHML